MTADPFVGNKVLLLAESMHSEVGGCTGVAARWCPLHGTCTCADREDLNDETCPLHATESGHPEGQAPGQGTLL